MAAFTEEIGHRFMSEIVWVVIVNYRTPALVVDCLNSLSDQISQLPGSRVVVVENNSEDGSGAVLRETVTANGWGEWVSIIEMERNGGFAYGNNAGISVALSASPSPNFFLLLNPDTVANHGALKALLNFMNNHSSAGISGGRIEDAAGAVGCSAHNFPSPVGEFVQGLRFGPISRFLRRHVVSPPPHPCSHECDWVSGACMMIRREVVDEIGFMDEGYFLYFEEVDYCRVARSAGWGVWYVPEARVMHLEGAATQFADKTRRRPSYWYESRRRYFVKHYGVSGLVVADLLWALGRIGYLFRCLLTPFSANKHEDPQKYAADLLWGDLRALISGSLWRIGRVKGQSSRSGA
jgi:N-acetylglucosaminyl-diphospho-decaprenol L-rhamnosyltransferase